MVHCATQRQAEEVLTALDARMAEVGLELHPAKTKIVYCKDRKRRLDYEHTSFTFLGYTFRVRKAPTRYYSPGLLHGVLLSAVCGLRGSGGCFEAGVVVVPAGAGLVAASPS